MRFLKQYFGVIVILLTVAVMAYVFFSGEMTNTVLLVSLVLIIVGILLMIFGGRAADKIGGK
jgi:ABC-type transport system involved in cytochrome bd biosynthesis fused ATPase/permease subunit